MSARHPFLDFEHPIAFAHRGGSLEAEENTMEAFARAVEMGFTHVETDVHATRDGVVVVHHDDTLERICGDGRAIAEMDWEEVSQVRTRGGAKIPRIEEVFDAFPKLCVNIELKDARSAEPLAEILRQGDLLDRVCVGAFNPRHTAAIRERLGPNLCWSPAHLGVAGLWLKGWGVPTRRPDYPVIQVPTTFNGIPVVTPRLIRAAARWGIDVQVWTVDDRAEMEALLDMGVRGIMTDRPSVLRDVLRARGQWNTHPA
ncbi:glycerophosphodiester phosphodiesterase [Hasllibacter sp. MH4015]|uniref:glycerophosphodiester phosphodiesterase n=1 Tax=Hasllibacter sp. MH4015 TaxID=2854029 RepID=UPI001CD3E46F|nr:glycerophosphodiester phosphodiesterase [Hasllibacter sp. MH4015]